MKVLEAFGEPIMSGGQEAFVFQVLKNMNTDNLSIDCLTAYNWVNNEYRHLVEKQGGAVYELKLPFHPGKSRMNIKEPFRAFLRNHAYDAVHIHSGSISVLAIMASVADKAGVKKVIVHSHSTGEHDSLKHKLLRLAASFSMRQHVDIYCACSQAAAEWKFAQPYAGKAIIIKNGIDTERFRFNPVIRDEYRKKLGISDRSLVLGHVGRFSHEKNQRFIVELFQEFQKRLPESKLLLVGDGEDRPMIEQMVHNKNDLSGKVILTGSVSNVPDYLQAMDVFILPSLYEGFAIVALEAQATGLPVIVSDTVPRDVKLTDNASFLSVKEKPYEQWINEILRLQNRQRTSCTEQIIQAGYDISNTAEIVRNIYVN